MKEAPLYYSGPVQLVAMDDDGRCHFQEGASNILSQIPGRLAVVGIAGPCKSGKSFLSNQLLGVQDGFEIGHTGNPCTKGLWIWGQPIELSPDYHCILIDSEGLRSSHRKAPCDMQILSLCLLLSSHFIFCTPGTTDENMIFDDFRTLLQASRHIQVQPAGKPPDDPLQCLSSHMPKLLWVLRDAQPQFLTDAVGRIVSERDGDILDGALKLQADQPEKNTVREGIRELFRDRDCAVVAGSSGEKVEAFVKKVYMSLSPKKFEGTLASAAMFACLVEEYCKATCAGVAPVIQSTWASAVGHQLILSLKEATQVYRSRMNDNAMMHLPMDIERLRDLHKAAKTEAVRIFRRPRIDVTDPKLDELRIELSNRIRLLYNHAAAENAASSKHTCERLMKELCKQHLGSGADPGTRPGKPLDELQQEWAQVHKTYLQRAKGPAAASVLSSMLPEELIASCRKAHLTEATGSADTPVQWPAERASLERQLEEANHRHSREKSQWAESETALREQVRILVERERTCASRSTQSTSGGDEDAAVITELQSVKNAVLNVLSEVQGVGIEKKTLELKVEHEKHLSGLERNFQRQLAEARRANESLIEGLRKTYEDEIDGLKVSHAEFDRRIHEQQAEREAAHAEVELQKQRLEAVEVERALQGRLVENAQRQSDLLTAFLERGPARDRGPVRSHTGLAPSPSFEEPPSMGARPLGSGKGVSAMPYSATNFAVFRSVPGV